MKQAINHKSQTGYDVVIGLEIHAELNTNTKMFCACKNDMADEPNANVCPVCLALPGALPMPSRVAIEKTITAGLAFDCDVSNLTDGKIISFERKNYFYPDLPKAYQISQMEQPVCLGGHVILKSGKKIRLNRIHLEEDAGKLLHDEVKGETYVDLNRGGVPLMEMVTEPDISSSTEAIEFLEQVRSRLVFSGTANCRMEEGGMRCDVNISLKSKGSDKLGDRVELKNINSFKMAGRAIEYEIKRQSALLDEGKFIKQETRRWNDAQGKSSPMRNKEVAFDYRYFPDPDQLRIRITQDNITRLRKEAIKSPLANKLKEFFINGFEIPEYEADILTRDKQFCMCFQKCVSLIAGIKSEPDVFAKNPILIKSAQKASRFMINVVLETAINWNPRLTAEQIIQMISLEDGITYFDSIISGLIKIQRVNTIKLRDLLLDNPNLDAITVAIKNELVYSAEMSDNQTSELEKIISELIRNNPSAVIDYKSAPNDTEQAKKLNFFIGQTMKTTQGKVDSSTVRELVIKALGQN